MDYNAIRRKSKAIMVGNVGIGGGYPISIQSMTNTKTDDHAATLAQCQRLQAAGCDIVRITVPTPKSAECIKYIKKSGINMPVVADIHFDYLSAIAAAQCGADKIRINPGNIGNKERIKEVVRVCTERKIPIRIGVNSGSLEEKILKKYGSPTAEALAESALYHASLLEELDFHDIAISVKSSDVSRMVDATRIIAEKTEYPIHLGVTEAGAREAALIKSGIGIGTLLLSGIGDTVRVSLTDKPECEISAAKNILRAIGLCDGMDIISCPTCGRTSIDLVSLLAQFEQRVKSEGLSDKNVRVAIMGCAVNGPGEAREADIGIAGGVGEGLLFRNGKIVRKIKEDRLVDELIEEIKEF